MVYILQSLVRKEAPLIVIKLCAKLTVTAPNMWFYLGSFNPADGIVSVFLLKRERKTATECKYLVKRFA